MCKLLGSNGRPWLRHLDEGNQMDGMMEVHVLVCALWWPMHAPEYRAHSLLQSYINPTPPLLTAHKIRELLNCMLAQLLLALNFLRYHGRLRWSFGRRASDRRCGWHVCSDCAHVCLLWLKACHQWLWHKTLHRRQPSQSHRVRSPRRTIHAGLPL